MNLVTLCIFLGLFAASMAAYAVHLRRFPIVRDGTRQEQHLSKPTRLFRYFLPTLQGGVVVALVLQCWVWAPEGPSLLRLALGTALGTVGVGLLVASLRALGRNFSRCEEPLLPYERVRTGPYRWVSHPIYLANTLGMAGIAIANFNALIAVLFAGLLGFYAIAVRDENRALDARFGRTAR